jgi:Escherichia/Staphylococcus phage prohead protease
VKELYRFANIDSASGDGMTISGLAIPFGAVATIRGELPKPYDETFSMGAFYKTLRGRNKPVPLLKSHDYRDWAIGGAEELVETDEGLMGTWRLSDVPMGRDAATLIRDGVLTGLSIGFEPLANRVTAGSERRAGRDLVERTEVKLHEVSLCTFPAYELAGVTGQRAMGGRSLAELALTRADLVDRFGRIAR